MGFTDKDEAKLVQVHPKLVSVIREARQQAEFSIIWGLRGEADQNAAFASGKSKLKYPLSAHNGTKDPLMAGVAHTISDAVDFLPIRTAFTRNEPFYYIAGIIKEVAANKGIRIRWGGMWDNDNIFEFEKPHGFADLDHVELLWN